jgi:Ni/Co efflux regulator RcnB
MKRVCLALVATLIAAAPAFAQHGPHPHRGPSVHKPVPQKHYAPRRHWSKGHVLPRNYRTRVIVERDYHRYHLRRPPHGHRWVRVDNDFILINAATGLIASIIAAGR